MNHESRRSDCPISSALDLLGDRWSLLVVRDIALGGKQYFNEFSASAEGISTNILSDRLRRLEESNILVKNADPADARRSVYALTERGLALVPVMVEFSVWASHYMPNTRILASFEPAVEANRDSWIGAERGGALTL